MLVKLQEETFGYFVQEYDPDTGLVADKTSDDAPASISATGLALSAFPSAVECDFIPREEAVERTLTILEFFANSQQGSRCSATGYKGFYYHFLDMKSGRPRLGMRAFHH